jgi:hypothetical protein
VSRLSSLPSSVAPRPGRRALVTLIAAFLVLALSGCQVKVAVDTQVNKDGSGTVKVSVGLDDKALQRLGDPSTAIKLDDMKAAGWVVEPPAKEADGLTWIRGTRPFANAAELTTVMEQLTAPPSMFTGYSFATTENDESTTYTLKGTIDPSKGVASFGDADLAAKLNGDAFGGNLAVIEAEEGKPIADMVNITVTATVADGAAKSYPVTLKDKQPTAVDVATVEMKPPPVLASIGIYAAVLLGVVLIVVMLVGARRRYTT